MDSISEVQKFTNNLKKNCDEKLLQRSIIVWSQCKPEIDNYGWKFYIYLTNKK